MKEQQKRQSFADNVSNATMSERTSEIVKIKAKLHDLIEDIGDWRNKHEVMSDEDFDEVVLSSVELEDIIDRWIIKSMDENLRSFSFARF